MSERDDLRSILFDSGDDGGPHVDERAAVDPVDLSEADEDETNDLSPEELVAASVRQTNEALGIEVEDEAEAEPVEASAAEDDDDIAALKEKARRWEEYEASQAEQAVESQRQAIVAEAQENERGRESDKQFYRNFYANEQVRLLEEMEADSLLQPNPEAYKRVHRKNIIDACRRDEDLKIRAVDAERNKTYNDLNTRFEAIDEQRKFAETKPAYADYLMVHPDLKLPSEDLEIRAEILRAAGNLTGEEALGAMTLRARQIAWDVKFLRERGQAVDQAAREVKAKEVKRSQPHPASATNAPRRAKDVQYAESGRDRLKQLSAIRALR